MRCYVRYREIRTLSGLLTRIYAPASSNQLLRLHPGKMLRSFKPYTTAASYDNNFSTWQVGFQDWKVVRVTWNWRRHDELADGVVKLRGNMGQ